MLDFLTAPYINTPWFYIVLELIAFFLGVLSVWYARKENILVFPTGLISTIIVVYLLYQTHDIGNMLVNLYFSAMSIFGWYNWKFGKTNEENSLKISKTNLKQRILGLAMGLFTFVLVYVIYTIFGIEITTITYLDLFTTAVFFTAMWYMALKKLESWLLWTIGNIIVIPLFIYRDLILLALQYVILTYLAVMAYLEWKKTFKNQHLKS
ncbi:nicotinamide riboside transporter PnuC [Flavobacterium agricola]|uniref:Nicotinamide riboside transporter PnuC n=1 Tax=Flavobacterium agricola TaxID=2870839 RepID=A0ABY6M080_9FLAO|nr:nicotinamide riboside transporter PnuC [Flavobacterium agricola]UYW00820.1 nicotinamide riboside transporter PnuC [Flavobacterium agricola]